MAKPKIISLFHGHRLQQCFPQLTVMGKAQSVFVECQSFDLILQVRGAAVQELDLFEDAVLRMIRIQVSSTEELAGSLALPSDLVKLIVMRLQEKRFLADPHTLSPQGAALLDQDSEQQAAASPVMAKLFRIPQTGRILPYIHTGEFRPVDVVQDGAGLKLEFGSRGSPVTVRGKFIRCDSDQVSRIRQQDCVKAIQLYNRLAGPSAFPQIPLLENHAIDSSRGERVFFHMQAAIQKGNVDFPIVSDGFVPNVDGLSAYIEEKNGTIFPEVRQNALELLQAESEALSSARTYGKYREVHKILDTLQSGREREADGGEKATRDDLQQESRRRRETLENCAVMLEWAFYYYEAENPISPQLRQALCRGSEAGNREIMLELARKIGLAPDERCASLFGRINEANIRRVERHHMPDFYIVFPLSVAAASEAGGGPVQSLFAEFPELLPFLDELFRAYRSLRHNGPGESALPDAERAKKLSAACALALLPELRENRDPNGAAGRDALSSASGSRLSAWVSLEQAMGSMFFNSLPGFVQDDWIRISPDKPQNRLPDPYNYVNILYRLLEGSLQAALTEGAGRTESLTLRQGVERAEENWGRRLPPSLTRVREAYFAGVQRGEKVPLGSCALYYLCTAGKDTVEDLKEMDFVAYVDQILALRRHGNQVGLCVDEEALAALRGQTMRVTKYVGGFS